MPIVLDMDNRISDNDTSEEQSNLEKKMQKRNWFNTLNDSLEAEGLVAEWKLGVNIQYGQTIQIITESFKLISVYRDQDGRYERPIHYSTV